jgi:DNA-binding NarL/FixJ family response regulator
MAAAQRSSPRPRSSRAAAGSARLVAAGMSNGEIAGVLFMSPLTAKTHVNRMMTKPHGG